MITETHAKGAVAKAKLAEYAVQQGWQMYLPFTDGVKGDAILEIDDELWKVELKYSSQKRGKNVIIIQVSNSQPRRTRNRQTKYHIGDFDLLVAYSAITDKLYVFAIDEVTEKTDIALRLAAPKNNQVKGVHWARDFEYNFERAIRIVKQRRQNA